MDIYDYLFSLIFSVLFFLYLCISSALQYLSVSRYYITMYVVLCIFYYIMFYMNKNEFALCNSMFKYFSKFPPLQKSVEEVVGAFFTFEVFLHISLSNLTNIVY